MRVLSDIDETVALAVARDNLTAPDEIVRRWASLILLPSMGAEVDVRALQALFEDATPLLRQRSLSALKQAQTWPPELACLATDMLADPDLGVRRAAVIAFTGRAEEIAASEVALREACAVEPDADLASTMRALLGKK